MSLGRSQSRTSRTRLGFLAEERGLAPRERARLAKMQDKASQVPAAPYKRIATEEAWCPAEMLDLYNDILKAGTLDDPGFMTMFGFYMNSPSVRTASRRLTVDGVVSAASSGSCSCSGVRTSEP